MLKVIAVGALVSLGLSSAAMAQTCSAYPYTSFSSGQPVHASQLMGNYTAIANCVNNLTAPLASPIFSGNVGIGISPAYPLDVNGNARVSGGIFTQAIQFLPGNEQIYDQGNGGVGITAGYSGDFVLQYNGNFTLNYNGIYANGVIQGTGFYAFSDERLKKNITPLSNGLGIIQNLNPVRYQWRGAKERTIGANINLTEGEAHLGFIAQQVAPILPEAVSSPKDAAAPYQMKPMELIAVLVETIKEQQAQLNQLKAQLASTQ